MYSSDLLVWLLDTIDAKLTGEHNSAVEAQLNPKKKPKQGKKIESFARMLAPARWRKTIEQAKKARQEIKASEIDLAEGMIANLKRIGAKA